MIAISSSATAEKVAQNNQQSDYGLPTHRRDGGSRGACSNLSNSCNLVALIPERTVGANASSSPKLFFYVPKIDKQNQLEFVLRDEQDKLIYEAFLTTEGAGIMSVDIPAEVQANVNRGNYNYHWYLSLIRDPQQRSRDIVVEGWMRQSEIDLAMQQQLDRVNSVERAKLYHDRGFWFDALAILANDYQSESIQPTVQSKWSELLESVGLEDMATKPFIESKLIESSIKN